MTRKTAGVMAAKYSWTEESGGYRWVRSDGAYVQRGGLLGGMRRPWSAVNQEGRLLSGRLYADWDVNSGPARTFGSSKSAKAALDKEWPFNPNLPTSAKTGA